MKGTRQPMRMITGLLIVSLAIGASQRAEAAEPLFSQPAGFAGVGAVAGGVASMAVGAKLIYQNGECADGCNKFFDTGPWGFVYLGAGAASAMLGTALIDWAATVPAQRMGRSASLRRWSYAAIGAGTLLASLGGALVMKENNDREERGSDPPAKFTAGRAIGWPAAVLGTAVALAGIEGLAFDVFSSSTADGQSKAAMGLSFRGRF